MTNERCRRLLREALDELINADYVLLDLPYFGNVGDVLIWQATLDLLKGNPNRCLYSASQTTYVRPDVDERTIIVFCGGGNFGDLWENHQVFRHRVMNDFPSNPVVQLPQSIWFESEEKKQDDIAFFAKHNGAVTLCLRDQQSYDLVLSNYKNVTARLLPDMALGMDVAPYINRYGLTKVKASGDLYVRRADKESHEQARTDAAVPSNATVADWPSQTGHCKQLALYYKLRKVLKAALPDKAYKRMEDRVFQHTLKDVILRSGFRFIASFERIYTTRLHCGILAYLLDRQVVMFDNSYKKVSGVYTLWLRDEPNIEMR